MRGRWGILLALPLTLAAQAGPKGSTQWRTVPADARFSPTSTKDAARDLAEFARCAAARRQSRVRDFLLAPYASAEQSSGFTKVVLAEDDPCIPASVGGSRMRLGPEVLAGALAQAMVLREYPELPAMMKVTVVDPAAEGALVARLHPAEAFGRCVVQRDPAAALALFASTSGKPEEAGAMTALADDLGPCLAAGSTLKVNRLFVRNVLGVAAYRLAHQLRAAPPGASVDRR